ncbi:hypothetical protein G6514_003765 [Epicoccum nigrum]|nr:hypothetical protein G6514_003765 [Epicoccum nigrum]
MDSTVSEKAPMDLKVPLLPQTQELARDTTMPRPTHKRKTHAAILAILFAMFWLARSWSCEHEHTDVTAKVPVDVHIMSKCPDARACLQKLVMPTMANISDKVDFRLSFIGQLTNEDDGVQCKHGQTECLGNIVLLCAAREYPDPKLHLGFANCLINEYPEIPKRQLIEDCALEHGLDFGVLNECMSKDSGAYGMGLLRDSVKHSQDVGAGISCTIRVDDKIRCVYDGGQWKDCEGGHEPGNLIADIERLYDEAQGWTLA